MNAADLINSVNSEKTQLYDSRYSPFKAANEADDIVNKLNNDSTAIDLAKTQANLNNIWTNEQYKQNELLANTSVRRKVIDLLKAGLNPYLAIGAFGAPTPSGQIPQNAMSAISGENKQKIDWKSFGAQTGMNIINGIIQASISGLTMYQIQKKLIQARQDAYDESREKQLSDMTEWTKKNRGKPINYDQYKKYGKSKPNFDWQMGARSLADGIVNAGDLAKSIIPLLFGIPNFNFGF